MKDQRALLFKAGVLMGLWLVLYSAYLIYGGVSLGVNILLATAWALVMVSIQMSVMHDASHKSSSEKPWVNTLLLNVISLLGGSPSLWVAQHCQAHHSFTNVPGKDHDIHTGGLLRLCHTQKRSSMHRYQHIYAWLLYPLFVLSWIWWGDFRDIKDNTYSLPKSRLRSILYETILVKIWHVAVFLVLPLLTIGNPWLVLVGYLVSFSIMGLIMVVVFQLAHVTMVQEFASESVLRESDWALFQLNSTANFAPNNKFLSWYLGGLNHQIEHHIFPYLSHTHYPKIQNQVKSTCQEHGVQYHAFATLWQAISSHQKHLFHYGRAQ
jgi:linoleoyl-CoA desaturase